MCKRKRELVLGACLVEILDVDVDANFPVLLGNRDNDGDLVSVVLL